MIYKLEKYSALSKVLPLLYFNEINNEKVLVISHEDLYLCLNLLKNHVIYRFQILSSISGVDLSSCKYRFAIAYDLLSIKYNQRIRLKIFLNEINLVESSTLIFPCSNWWEREIWDLYGIFFIYHPDLRRILTDYGFEGYPMRKDFPLSGFVEIRYDQVKRRIVIEPIELTQEYRFFSFELPWEK